MKVMVRYRGKNHVMLLMIWWKMKKFKFSLHPLKKFIQPIKLKFLSPKKTIISARLFAVCQQQQFYIILFTLYIHYATFKCENYRLLADGVASNYHHWACKYCSLEKTSANFKNHFFKLATPEVPQKSIRYLVYWKK